MRFFRIEWKSHDLKQKLLIAQDCDAIYTKYVKIGLVDSEEEEGGQGRRGRKCYREGGRKEGEKE